MKRIFGIFLFAFLVSAAGPALAEAKIGYVDLQRALNQSDAGQAAKQQIGKTVEEYEGRVEQRQRELQKLKEELEKQALVLADEARAARERDYQQKVRDYQRFTQDIQEELQRKDAQFTQRILRDLIQVIDEVGKKEGYTLVLEKTESSILYASEKIDMTDQVIKAYNERYKKQAK
jgi:outer membrane protein